MGALAVFGAAACHKSAPAPLQCNDSSMLSPGDAQIRTALAYKEVSTEPGKNCSGCTQFLPGPPNACGTCKVLKGSINPSGYCRSFQAKAS